MDIKVILFGQLTDIVKESEILLSNVSDTDSVVNALNKAYPELASSKYAIALDKKVIKTNTVLSNGSVIALLPPFSGG